MRRRSGRGYICRPATSHLHRLVPARLLHLVVDDRLVLGNAIVAGTREDRLLLQGGGGDREREKRQKREKEETCTINL